MLTLSYTQCKQIQDVTGSLRGFIDTVRDQPAWITQHLDLNDIQAIQHGGCASGAYMPAVTYSQAAETMNTYGDDVLQFIEDNYGELPPIPDGCSWDGIAVHYLSCAVELWAGQFDLSDVDWD